MSDVVVIVLDVCERLLVLLHQLIGVRVFFPFLDLMMNLLLPSKFQVVAQHFHLHSKRTVNMLASPYCVTTDISV
eukprot:6342588-Pyramimonas_sp.AAC.1